MNNIWKFIWQYEVITESQNYQADCADIVFFNNGTSLVTINGLTLQAGDSMPDNAFGNEYSNTNYAIYFDNTGTNKLMIKRKVYLGIINFKNLS